ncbi:aspartyl-phosphate phosphatase Spo0E family protein [Anaerosalibacter bizertensis]|uniref:Aspartyl-phosphate phosphatase Spo0E family protein n=1 Tax=Anaerosalibacter bizertensis TaxID=932217 RepID=A0A9Q4FM27_9FIRM|nr:aspartyl-phosphate phosphatase Spo0E family protein [Anaerosalibacter bizertensis]MBV1817972.1 aspartyl-phosphate phosphatase Spo0E family protein [Bacteroidales bacterium MSK.15.36]MCG4572885.1 aspartyl-phosphate phosphatase Spo0E family protein [Clostridium cochlearium]MCB5559328.1 aspartyl-phosphate phosphatase Spo0E family protein [Anaerosalibacter bizertensis]MCG4565225.1 aspartyl-phosphate phosphatase Spo0E family protein [Anaerosalibacter bizertensis]MCG4581983.1 aspartyl-phosphate p
MLDKVEKIREKLNKQVNLKDVNTKEVLKISKELDEAILEYYKEGIK